MTNLTEFLLARIAEDEVVARAYNLPNWEAGESSIAIAGSATSFRVVYDEGAHAAVLNHIARWDPARVLAECEVKRQIVSEHLDQGHHGDPVAYCTTCDNGFHPYPCVTLRAVALPYATHPGYRQEWAL